MIKDKKLKRIAYAAAFLSALYVLIEFLVILNPQYFYERMNGYYKFVSKPQLTALVMAGSAYPLLLTGISLFMAVGKELKRGKATAALIMMILYYSFSGLRTYAAMTVSKLSMGYGMNVMASYGILGSALSMLPPLATIAMLLAAAVAAIEFYESRRIPKPLKTKQPAVDELHQVMG